MNTMLSLVHDASWDHAATVPPAGALNKWATWMRAAGLSEKTITGRTESVDLFTRRMHVNPETVTWEPIAEFLAGYKPGTQQYYRANLRAWFHWLILMDIRTDDPTVKLHRGKPIHRKPRPLTAEQVGKLLDAHIHPRTLPMILLGAYQGFRVMEIAKFRGDDIHNGMVGVVGKGGTYDEVPLHPLVAQVADGMPADWWFPSYFTDGPIQANSASSVISQVMRRVGIKSPLTPHSLRHFYGTELLRTTGNLALVQRLMRHTNITSTVKYTEVDLDQRRAAVHSLPVTSRLHLVA